MIHTTSLLFMVRSKILFIELCLPATKPFQQVHQGKAFIVSAGASTGIYNCCSKRRSCRFRHKPRGLPQHLRSYRFRCECRGLPRHLMSHHFRRKHRGLPRHLMSHQFRRKRWGLPRHLMSHRFRRKRRGLPRHVICICSHHRTLPSAAVL